jgi:DNA-directed RNA polymerase specialized sigma24 family protein
LTRLSENPETVEERMAEEYRSEQRHQCLESCVAKLEPETRNLILAYYEEEAGRKVRNRQQLAEAMGIPMNALRIRAHRIRAKLEKCLKECLNRSADHEMDSRFRQ